MLSHNAMYYICSQYNNRSQKRKVRWCILCFAYDEVFTDCVVQDQNKLWQPVDKTLKTLAVELAEFQVDWLSGDCPSWLQIIIYQIYFFDQVCCDLFITTQEYVDIASLAVVPATTGGQVLNIWSL